MHAHSRRGFLARTLGAGWLGASLMEKAVLRAAQARAQAPAAASRLFDIDKVADGVYAAVARPAAQINCNAAIFENAKDVLIVDTHSKPSAAAALAAQIRKEITPKPVRYIVNTHFHWDHIQGAPAYRRIAPAAEIVSSTATRDLIAELSAARLKQSLEQAAKSLDDWREQLAKATSPEERAYYEKLAADTRAYISEMRGWTPELPSITFREDLILHDRAHELHLAFRGRGHTAGDVVVFCPQKRAVAAGDLLHGFFPFLADAYPREWPRTLRTVAEFDFESVIGGHGAVQRSRERLAQMAAYIEELTNAVAQRKAAGLTPDRIQAEVTPASLRSLAGGYGEFVAGQSIRYYAQLQRSSPAEVLAGGVRGNVADIFKALERS